jgi:hypothetical protein
MRGDRDQPQDDELLAMLEQPELNLAQAELRVREFEAAHGMLVSGAGMVGDVARLGTSIVELLKLRIELDARIQGIEADLKYRSSRLLTTVPVIERQLDHGNRRLEMLMNDVVRSIR